VKTAVNAITVQFACELHETPIKVNAAGPGWVATDMNRHRGVHAAPPSRREPPGLVVGQGIRCYLARYSAGEFA
jgi:NAD(P)-dependent dehydrogenase (short-subunit alcohol dehydrogenase family)